MCERGGSGVQALRHLYVLAAVPLKKSGSSSRRGPPAAGAAPSVPPSDQPRATPERPGQQEAVPSKGLPDALTTAEQPPFAMAVQQARLLPVTARVYRFRKCARVQAHMRDFWWDSC